jgi:signal peptidase
MMTVRRIASLIGWVLCIAVLILIWPTRFGGWTSLTVVSGESMVPTYFTGDLVGSWKSGDYEPGDIVVYRVPQGEEGAGHQVIHRLLSVDAEGRWSVQGDNKPSPDPWHPTAADIVGEAVFVFPGLGSMLNWVPLLLALGAGVLVTAGLWPRRSDGDGDGDDDDDDGRDDDGHGDGGGGRLRRAAKHRAPGEIEAAEPREEAARARILQGAGTTLTIAVVAILASSAAAFDRPASAAGFGGITAETAGEWVLTGQQQLALPCVAPDECPLPMDSGPDGSEDPSVGPLPPEGANPEALSAAESSDDPAAEQTTAPAPVATEQPTAPEQSAPIEAPAVELPSSS